MSTDPGPTHYRSDAVRAVSCSWMMFLSCTRDRTPSMPDRGHSIAVTAQEANEARRK
ncbi:hypothetical protein GCM10010399_47730 [Dactylosporangium fulvum]